MMKLSLLSLVLPLSVAVATEGANESGPDKWSNHEPCTYPSGDECACPSLLPNGDECADDSYCAIEEGKCALEIASQPGTCAYKGTMACPAILAPVCGCDMNTYDNDCSAVAAGVNVVSTGPCADASADGPAEDGACTFPGGDECGDDQYCAIEDGKCALRIASQPGTCASKGIAACTMVLNPVCGCDMNTYVNYCLAGADGVNVIAEGPCDAGADASADAGVDTPPLPGFDSCTRSPDDSCYVDGWPQCCFDEDQPCPPDRQPRCDNHGGMSGWNYCTYAPDTECYASGWPACCGRFDGTNCPSEQPNCDAPGMEATLPLGLKMSD